jgi:molybdopterin synthase sulfur carrier subunit
VITLRLRFFAALREALGDGETLTLASPATVADVRAQLVARGGEYARLLDGRRAVRAALDHAVCEGASTIEHDAELAFFPPVTGG